MRGRKINMDTLPQNIDEINAVIGNAPGDVLESAPSIAPDEFRPRIIVNNRQLPDVVADVICALADQNMPPKIFTRGGNPVCINEDRGRLSISPISEAAMRGRIARAAMFYRVKSKDQIGVNPPVDVVRDIMALDLQCVAEEMRLNPFPQLEGITTIPVLRPDFTILDNAGYDPGTRLFYAPAPGFSIPEISDRPTGEDIGYAVELINEAVGEFPYETQSDHANALGTLITPIIRNTITGKSPLAVIDAPQAGTGKSLFAEAVGLIITGDSPAMMGAPNDEDEWRKQLTSALATGPSMVVIDNVDTPLMSSALARALTAPVWTDRLLGSSQNITVAQRATWIATGNNVEIGGDMPRRCYRIRLDARTARPWRGRDFTHPNLIEWLRENRGRLISSILILCRAWENAGRPLATKSPVIGSFEEWCRTIGGILAFAGVDGFLGNLNEMYENVDDGATEWEAFFRTWWKMYGSDGVTTNDLVEDVQRDEGTALRESLPDEVAGYVIYQPPRYMESAKVIIRDAGRFKIKLGKILRKLVGRRYGNDGLHLAREENTHAKTSIWSIRFAGSAGIAGDVCPRPHIKTNSDFLAHRVKTLPPLPDSPQIPEVIL